MIIIRVLAGVSSLILIFGAIACSGDCAGIGVEEIRPGTQRTLHVGESFTAEYWEGGACAGTSQRDIERRDVWWSTNDTLTLAVDSASGLVRAIGRGDGQVWFRDVGRLREPAAMRGGIDVHVE